MTSALNVQPSVPYYPTPSHLAPTSLEDTMTQPTTTATVDLVAVQAKIQTIMAEQHATHVERTEVIPGLWTAAVAQQHLLMVAPGGTGKSFLTRDVAKRITGSSYFEIALDETSTPDQILGAPDIKAMVENGKTRRVSTGMLPEAHYAFLDEFFNANGPALHSIMPILNERIFHNNGKPVPTPLRSAVMATNKLNADADQAALWDRVHHRHVVGYVSDRDNLRGVVADAVKRQVSTFVPPSFTTISLAEIDAAHDAAMSLPISDIAFTTFLDIKDDLERKGVVVSTRRVVEAMKGVLATAWLAGHDEVKVGDLSVLRHMLWSTQDHIPIVKTTVLEACNPGEKKALDLLDDLDTLKAEFSKATELDDIKANTASMDIFKKTQRLTAEATPLLATATKAGANTNRIQEVLTACETLRLKICKERFAMTDLQIEALNKATH